MPVIAIFRSLLYMESTIIHAVGDAGWSLPNLDWNSHFFTGHGYFNLQLFIYYYTMFKAMIDML